MVSKKRYIFYSGSYVNFFMWVDLYVFFFLFLYFSLKSWGE